MVSCSSIFLLVVNVGMVVQCSSSFVLQSDALVPLSDGGRDADPNGIARSVVQIVENGQTVCTGSIIDSFTVVTAKHCFEDGKGNLLSTLDYKFEVVYGSVQRYDPNNESNFRRISIQDDGYHHHDSLDVTVLRLETEMIDAIRMELDKDSSTKCDMPVQLYGFGALDGDGSKASVMQVLDTVVKNGCGEVLDDNYIITKVDGKTACEGDSGGPLINVQTGKMLSILESGGEEERTCRPGDLNFTIKLSKVMDFIRTYCKQCNVNE